MILQIIAERVLGVATCARPAGGCTGSGRRLLRALIAHEMAEITGAGSGLRSSSQSEIGTTPVDDRPRATRESE